MKEDGFDEISSSWKFDLDSIKENLRKYLDAYSEKPTSNLMYYKNEYSNDYGKNDKYWDNDGWNRPLHTNAQRLGQNVSKILLPLARVKGLHQAKSLADAFALFVEFHDSKLFLEALKSRVRDYCVLFLDSDEEAEEMEKMIELVSHGLKTYLCLVRDGKMPSFLIPQNELHNLIKLFVSFDDQHEFELECVRAKYLDGAEFVWEFTDSLERSVLVVKNKELYVSDAFSYRFVAACGNQPDGFVSCVCVKLGANVFALDIKPLDEGEATSLVVYPLDDKQFSIESMKVILKSLKGFELTPVQKGEEE